MNNRKEHIHVQTLTAIYRNIFFNTEHTIIQERIPSAGNLTKLETTCQSKSKSMPDKNLYVILFHSNYT